MQPSFKLPFEFDPERLRADLDGILSGEYVPHFNTQYYQGNWSAVPLRSIGGQVRQIYPDPMKKTEYAETPFLARCPYIRHVIDVFECPKLMVRFLRLGAGSVIKEHCDYNLGFEDGEARLHIPVVTNDKVIFILGGKRLVMKEGECWYSDFNLPHSVRNEGETDRIHLVIDCVVNDWLKEVLLRADEAAARAVSQANHPVLK